MSDEQSVRSSTLFVKSRPQINGEWVIGDTGSVYIIRTVCRCMAAFFHWQRPHRIPRKPLFGVRGKGRAVAFGGSCVTRLPSRCNCSFAVILGCNSPFWCGPCSFWCCPVTSCHRPSAFRTSCCESRGVPRPPYTEDVTTPAAYGWGEAGTPVAGVI